MVPGVANRWSWCPWSYESFLSRRSWSLELRVVDLGVVPGVASCQCWWSLELRVVGLGQWSCVSSILVPGVVNRLSWCPWSCESFLNRRCWSLELRVVNLGVIPGVVICRCWWSLELRAVGIGPWSCVSSILVPGVANSQSWSSELRIIDLGAVPGYGAN